MRSHLRKDVKRMVERVSAIHSILAELRLDVIENNGNHLPDAIHELAKREYLEARERMPWSEKNEEYRPDTPEMYLADASIVATSVSQHLAQAEQGLKVVISLLEAGVKK